MIAKSEFLQVGNVIMSYHIGSRLFACRNLYIWSNQWELSLITFDCWQELSPIPLWGTPTLQCKHMLPPSLVPLFPPLFPRSLIPSPLLHDTLSLSPGETTNVWSSWEMQCYSSWHHSTCTTSSPPTMRAISQSVGTLVHTYRQTHIHTHTTIEYASFAGAQQTAG